MAAYGADGRAEASWNLYGATLHLLVSLLSWCGYMDTGTEKLVVVPPCWM